MQWHWGNIGSAVAGLSALTIAIAALIRSPAALRDWRARLRAQAEAAREEAETIRMERRRGLSGWSRTGVNDYGVTLVTDPAELRAAADELASGEPTAYVTIRVSGNGNRAASLRQLIEAEGIIARAPTAGECEALKAGLEAMDIPRAAYG